MNTLPTSVKVMKCTAFVLFLSLLFSGATTVQAQKLTIGSVQACTAPEVLVPVTGDNLVSIGAITLFITFDSTQITFLSIENIDQQLNGNNYSLNTSPFQLAFVWSKVVPVDFLQKKLFDIRFAYKGKASSVTFKTNCEISNSQLQVIPVNYINGSVSSGIPQITLQPKDTIVKSWALSKFNTIATNAQNYLWKISTDQGQTWAALTDNTIYQGTHSNMLTINYTPPIFNKYRYMCVLNSETCTTTTMQAILNVDTLASVMGHSAVNDFQLQNKPNPVTGFTNIEYTLPGNGNVTLDVFDIFGNIIAQPVKQTQTTGSYSILFNASDLTPGLYFYRLSFKNEISGFTASRKMIKQIN